MSYEILIRPDADDEDGADFASGSDVAALSTWLEGLPEATYPTLRAFVVGGETVDSSALLDDLDRLDDDGEAGKLGDDAPIPVLARLGAILPEGEPVAISDGVNR